MWCCVLCVYMWCCVVCVHVVLCVVWVVSVCACGVVVRVVVLVVRMIIDTASLSWRVRTMHLIQVAETWEQAPGVPATRSPR